MAEDNQSQQVTNAQAQPPVEAEMEVVDEAVAAALKDALKIGIGVAILLAAFTLGEYWIGLVAGAWWAPLIGIAVLKAFLIIRDYMHIGRLFAAEEEAH